MSAGLRFLPWVRDGLSRVVSTPDTLTGALPRTRAGVTLAAHVTGVRSATGVTEEITGETPAVLHGPGDVASLDARQVIRSFPAPGAENVDVTLFAAVEFDRPDLPWLYTPVRPDDDGRLRPWLVLVTVPAGADTGEIVTVAGDALPRLRTAAEELPVLGESWAWGHAQVLVIDGETPADVIAGAPDRTLSRLICPRRLAAGTDYVAAVVPAFHTGVQAGLGLPVDESGPLAPAWGPGSAHPEGRVELPVYHHWRFRTGADGDFESLARRLRARALPADVGRTAVDVGAAGGGLPAITPPGVEGRSVLGFEGALASPSLVPSSWDPAVAGPWKATMRALLAHSTERLTPPLYGGVHTEETELPPNGTEPLWLAGLNLDPRYRAAAALGTKVVQKHQEELAAAAWQRAAEVRAAGDTLRSGQAARDGATGVFAKRLDPATPGEALPDARLLGLTRPAHDQVPPTPPPTNRGKDFVGRPAGEPTNSFPRFVAGGSLADVLAANPGVRGATSAAFRRLTRPGGPLARRAATAGGAAPQALPRLAEGISPIPPAHIPEGGWLFEAVAREQLSTVDVAKLQNAARWWDTTAEVTMFGPAALADEPETYVTSNGGDALGFFSLFVATGDGRLFERRELGGTWVWHDHGSPPGVRIVTSAAVVPTYPGVPNAVPTHRVYVCGSDRHLWERLWDGDRWVWNDRGAPGGGVRNRPVTVDDNYQHLDPWVYMLGADGNVHRFHAGTRAWETLGAPVLGTGERLFGAPRPTRFNVHVATTANRLFVRDFGGGWRAMAGVPPVWGSLAGCFPYGSGQSPLHFCWVTPNGELVTWNSRGVVNRGRPPSGPVVSLAQTGLTDRIGYTDIHVLVSTGTGLRMARLHEWDTDARPDGPFWTWDESQSQPPGGFGHKRPGPFIDAGGRLTMFAVSADGRLISRGQSLAEAWTDHGRPRDVRGAGPAGAPPAADVRWTPKTGLLASTAIAHVVDEGQGSRLRWQAGHGLSEAGQAASGGYTGPVNGPAYAARWRAAGMALGKVTATGRPSAVVATLAPGPDNTQRIACRLGRDLDQNGTPAGGWTELTALPDAVNADACAVDVALADLDGDGRPEVVVVYGVGGSGPNRGRVFYRIGWGLDASGIVTQGWSDSVAVAHTFGRIDGVGVDVADMTGDRTPDLVVLVHGGDAENRPYARFCVGRGVNRRGQVTGGWTTPVPAPDEATGAYAAGAGIAVCDLTGTRRPDVLVSRLALDTVAKRFTVQHRVGFDCDAAGAPVRWSALAVSGSVAYATPPKGAALTIADLRPDLVAARLRMGDAFMTAAMDHQSYLVPAQTLASDHAPPAVPVDAAAEAVRAAVRPESAVASRVLEDLRIGGRPLVEMVPDTGDPLRRLLAGVTFNLPAYELLRGLSQEHIAPGLPAVRPETMTALAANPRFIEAFMVGLNHEMSREMLWREFPADPKQTWFRQFWDVRGAASAGPPLTDLPPLTDVAWRRGALGTHLTSVGAPGENALILVIRGELLRRFPSTVVTMRRALWTGPEQRVPTGADILPIFNAYLSPDLLLFGFPLTAPVARGAARRDAGDPGYFFILREQPTAPRFGLDAEPDGSSNGTLAHWDDLHWGHLPPDAAFLSPYAPGLPTGPLDGAVFGRGSADMARVTLQRPVMLARHASDLLLPENP